MKTISKILSVVLCLSIILGLGLVASAASTAKVTDAATIKQGGQYVLVASYGGKYYAVKNEIAQKPAAVEVTVSGDTVTAVSGNLPVWTVAASGTGISLSDGSKYLSYGITGTNFSNATAAYTFNLTARGDGSFTVAATTGTNRALAYQDENCRFASYSTSNDKADSGYTFAIQFFKFSGTQTDTRENLPTTSGAIVDAIFSLGAGEQLSDKYKYEGNITLTGTVAGTASWSDQFDNGEVTIKVLNSANQEKNLLAFRFKAGSINVADIKALANGDIVTFSGNEIKNYGGTYEICYATLTKIEKAAVSLPALPTDTADIVDAIFDLKNGETLNMYYKYDSFTLTGTVVGENSWSDDYSNGEVTIKIDGTNKEILAWRYGAGQIDLDVVKNLAEGDKVTFTVESVKNYNDGTFEMEYPTLTAVEKAGNGNQGGGGNTTGGGNNNDDGGPDNGGDNTAIFGMSVIMVMAVAAMAVLVIGKKKLF